MSKRESFNKEFKLEALPLLEVGNKPAAEIAPLRNVVGETGDRDSGEWAIG